MHLTLLVPVGCKRHLDMLKRLMVCTSVIVKCKNKYEVNLGMQAHLTNE